jgi:GxxExxY protein
MGVGIEPRLYGGKRLKSSLAEFGGMQQEGEKAGRFGDCSERVIGACIEVHRYLGPGLLESAYGQCLAHELGLRGLSFERELQLPVRYKGVELDCGYRLDFVVERELIVEIKAVERLLPVHEAQVITYLRLTGVRAGLLVNFNTVALRRGLRRLTLNPKTLPTFPPSCESGSRTRSC